VTRCWTGFSIILFCIELPITVFSCVEREIPVLHVVNFMKYNPVLWLNYALESIEVFNVELVFQGH